MIIYSYNNLVIDKKPAGKGLDLHKAWKYSLGIGLGAAVGGVIGYLEKCSGST
jgi:hypothetical protein